MFKQGDIVHPIGPYVNFRCVYICALPDGHLVAIPEIDGRHNLPFKVGFKGALYDFYTTEKCISTRDYPAYRKKKDDDRRAEQLAYYQAEVRRLSKS